MVSFAVQKILSLIIPHSFITTFISIALGEWAKKTVRIYAKKRFTYVLF